MHTYIHTYVCNLLSNKQRERCTCLTLHATSCVGRAYELFTDGFDLHILSNLLYRWPPRGNLKYQVRRSGTSNNLFSPFCDMLRMVDYISSILASCPTSHKISFSTIFPNFPDLQIWLWFRAEPISTKAVFTRRAAFTPVVHRHKLTPAKVDVLVSVSSIFAFLVIIIQMQTPL